jgi:hypothetical protein
MLPIPSAPCHMGIQLSSLAWLFLFVPIYMCWLVVLSIGKTGDRVGVFGTRRDWLGALLHLLSGSHLINLHFYDP